jgi:homoserine kinase
MERSDGADQGQGGAVPRRIRVRVPGSTSNLGAGFDCIGLAVDRWLEAEWEPAPGGELRLERRGTLAELTGAAADDLLVRVLLGAWRDGRPARAAAAPPGAAGPAPAGVLRATSQIPLARGLGSSAAAVVAGLALAGRVPAGAGGAEDALAEAAAWEGHPDNVAPALVGGLVAVVPGEAGVPRLLRLPLSPHIGWAYAAPGTPVGTAEARAALPATVPHGVAAAAAARMAALLAGLEAGDPELLRAGFADELHVPYRLPLIPGAAQAGAAARGAGAWAVTISGSGSGLLAVCAAGHEAAVAEAMTEAFAAAGPGAVGFPLRPAPGVSVEVER